MEIKDLEPKQGKVDLVAVITEKEEPRSFDKFGKQGKVCNAVIKDDTGEIKLTLWNEQADQFSVGDKIKVTNGYVNEWQGEKQLTSGKFGQIEVVEKAAQPTLSPHSPEKEPHTEDDVLDDDAVPEEDLSKA